MFRPLELFVGLRYTRAKRRNHFISFISLSSMLGIALGVMALITVLSVMNGFVTELRDRILGMTAHITVGDYGGLLNDWRRLDDRLNGMAGVLATAPYINKEAMFINGQQVNGGMVRGVLPDREATVSTIGDKMVEGSLDDLAAGSFNLILGADLARLLRVGVGDRVTLVTPTANISIAGVIPRMRRFLVVGIFDIGMYEYDSTLALTHLEDAQILYRFDQAVSGIRLHTRDLFAAPRLRAEVSRLLEGEYLVRDWSHYHANFFRAVQTEKRMMFIILSLIVAVAAFNIVSTLVMVVNDKEGDIAILRTLGMTPASIMAIFIIQGTVIGLVGTLLGVISGVALALNLEMLVPLIEHALDMEFMPADVYYISDLPSELHWDDVGWITSIAFGLSLLATLYPAWRASRLQPAEALRYE
jgi:lipoprotein-releasing system permease protein